MEYRRITQIKSTDGLLDLRGERRWRLSDADERPVARLAYQIPSSSAHTISRDDRDPLALPPLLMDWGNFPARFVNVTLQTMKPHELSRNASSYLTTLLSISGMNAPSSSTWKGVKIRIGE